MNHLVIGCGEVGKALMEVLGCAGYDPQKGYMDRDGVSCDMMHVCIPYQAERPDGWSENVVWQSFEQWVLDYKAMFRPSFTVIHSTVPIGTSDLLGAHHSPIRGRHPHLAASIRTFQKYVGGPDAVVICQELQKFGIETIACSSSRDTEAGKLIDLMQFGQSVLLEKTIHDFCTANSLDYDLVYRHFNKSYNTGYRAMGDDRFIRPILDHVDGPIGGHCVVQNMKWLPMKEADQIIHANEKLSRPPEAIANAKLIDAAPDLLQALEIVDSAFESLSEFQTLTSVPPELKAQLSAAWGAASAAISKARGLNMKVMEEKEPA